MNINTYMLIERLKTYPVFTLDDLCALTKKDPSYCKVMIGRLVKRGIVKRIQRNRFTLHDDPLIIATRIAWPSYISLWYALHHHGLTDQIPNEISVLTTATRHSKNMEFMNMRISFSTIPVRYLFGYTKEKVSVFDVFMADPEKCLLDSILLKRISLEEIFFMIKEDKNTISSTKLSEYAKRSGNLPAMKRIGWLLDTLELPGTDVLLGSVKGAFIPLDYSRPEKGEGNSRWKVKENLV
ncbi:MAG: hypothetical protein QCI82_05365 [Candidatus Thermoplasmatota archaeon]|nr:hypothetical protein [Candidatus Thermoplasmatota archaeon]